MMQDYQQELNAIKDLLKQNPGGMSVTDIAKSLGKNKNTVGRYLDILLISGQVDMRTYGMAKVFTLSQRIPLPALLSFSKELILVLDEDSRIVEINDNFLNLLRMSREGAVGKNIAFLNPPDVDIHELLEDLADTKRSGEHMFTLTFGDDKERFFSGKRVPTVFEDGRKGLTVIIDDITDQILAERELRESEERFRMMAENIRDGLVILENNTFVYANRRVQEITGYSLDTLKKMGILDIVASKDRAEVEKWVNSTGEVREVPEELGVWIVRKDGSCRFVYSRISHVQHQDAFLVYIVLTDITELKRKEDALRESEHRFRMMAENIHEGLAIIENKKIVYSNHRMSEITGFEPHELTSVDITKLLASDKTSQKKMEQILRQAKAGSNGLEMGTVRITRKDGTRRCINVNVTAAEQEGTVSVYIMATDITSFVERENALRERIVSLQEFIS